MCLGKRSLLGSHSQAGAWERDNSVKIPGPTDEERLNDPAFRASAGNAIATAIDQFIVNVLDQGE